MQLQYLELQSFVCAEMCKDLTKQYNDERPMSTTGVKSFNHCVIIYEYYRQAASASTDP
jgi:hypothetical protein